LEDLIETTIVSENLENSSNQVLN